MNVIVKSQKRNPKEILDQLDKACRWAAISRGRAIEYSNLFKHFMFEDQRSREGMFSYNELMGIIEIFELWEEEVEFFPGLKSKIRKVFSKGPVLEDDENPANSSNRPRNDSFVFLLAGKIKKAGITVRAVEEFWDKRYFNVSDGEPCFENYSDITIDLDNFLYGIECKRPQSLQKVEDLAKEARKQLEERNDIYEGGVIAMDCSAAIRPNETILGNLSSKEEAANFLENIVMKTVQPKIETELKPSLLGAILYARVPVHTLYSTSPIISLSGAPFTTYTQNTVSSVVFMENSACPRSEFFRSITSHFESSLN